MGVGFGQWSNEYTFAVTNASSRICDVRGEVVSHLAREAGLCRQWRRRQGMNAHNRAHTSLITAYLFLTSRNCHQTAFTQKVRWCLRCDSCGGGVT